ncbi:MAG TPA: phosphoribosylformylglycinamidine synthase subunit PurS [Candidatus Dormibacteraeota bacterium]|jgi:phosphoribosylformylglycinamidine synthase|nr:phosphoribosylformylglycinamidine synthase subunit PurS [Candidatus Dormibacteraeota bacterium]
MAAYRAEVRVTLKPLVNDPQGLVIRDALRTLGFHEVEGVRAGKLIVIDLDAPNRVDAQDRVDQMCRKLLANPVIEAFEALVAEVAAV